MENAKTMREIALAARKEKTTKEIAQATVLVEGAISDYIMKMANNGEVEAILHIPAGYSIPFVIEILENYGYRVVETQKYRDYLIKW